MTRVANALIDRDGTIIVERHYLHDPEQVELVPGAGEALALLSRAGVSLFVVTNQSGIGRGYYSEADFRAVQERLAELLAPFGVTFQDVAFCPHAPDEACDCRKPEPGMWNDLCAAHGLKPEETVMIGDNASDVAFGRNCGFAQSVLVLTGHGKRFAQDFGLPGELPAGAPCESSEGAGAADRQSPCGSSGQTGCWLRLDAPGPGQPTALARDLGAAVDFILAEHCGTSS